MYRGSVALLHEPENFQIHQRICGDSEADFTLRRHHFVKSNLELQIKLAHVSHRNVKQKYITAVAEIATVTLGTSTWKTSGNN